MTAQLNYLVSELGILAWGASVQRAHIYKNGIDPAPKPVGEFRQHATRFLSSELLPQYKYLVDESQHYRNIERLIKFATEKGQTVLGPQGYKYGVAQKLLNLTLKYHWCLGLAEEPPHCPVDRTVINKTRFKGKINWTEINDRTKYKTIIEDVRRLALAQGLSIAVWELTCFSRRS